MNSFNSYITVYDTYGIEQSNTEATVNLATVIPVGRVAGSAVKGAGALVNLTEEVFSQALFKGVEKVGGYSVYSTKGLIGGTFNRNIFLSGGKSLSGFRSFVGSLEAEALGAGASKISIYGSSVINRGFLNPNIARRFGYTFEQSGSGVFLQKTLRP